MRARPTWCAVAALVMVAACDGTPRTGAAPERSVKVTVVDEKGSPVQDARISFVGRATPFELTADQDLGIDQPIAGVVHADGFLDEPVVIDPHDGDVRIRLTKRLGPDGSVRRVLQFGGDFMLGRRYQSTVPDVDTPIVRNADQARAVVADIAPLMAAADASMVNLETVIGDLSPLDAYPAKQFLIQSPPLAIDALQQMGIDLVALGNNHSYDWLEEGVQSTITHLDAAGMPWAGAGVDAAQAEAGRMLDVGGLSVGVVSTTTANGDFFNDSLPLADDPVPADVPAGSRWQFETRAFQFGSPGDPAYVEPDNRRAGDIWRLFDTREPDLPDEAAAALWAEIRRVYPELQDAVARRGHGGAARFRRFDVARQVQALRDRGARLVVVQIHGGTQFSEVPSESMRRATHDAIDGGADLVIGHHPHVLQGFEWYRGRLIAYSLGNLLFDQDLLSTFPSLILRTVFEDDRLISTSVIPIILDRYRPAPASGPAGERVVRGVNASSLLAASTVRLTPALVGSVLDPTIDDVAVLRPEGASYILTDRSAPAANTFSVGEAGLLAMSACSVVRLDADPPEGAMVGVDLLGWGTLDDGLADRVNDGGVHWRSDGTTRHDGGRGTYLHLEADAHSSARARQVARSEVPAHRLFDPDGTPVDGEPRYTVQLDIRRDGAVPHLRLALYDVTDVPNEEPTSVRLTEADIDLPLTRAGEWRTVTVELSELINATHDGVRPEAALLYIVAPPGDNRLDFDNVRLYEWRTLSDLPRGVWVPADALSVPAGSAATAPTDVRLDVHGCSSAR